MHQIAKPAINQGAAGRLVARIEAEEVSDEEQLARGRRCDPLCLINVSRYWLLKEHRKACVKRSQAGLGMFIVR